MSAVEQPHRSFFLQAMLWLPLGFALWFYVAGAMVYPTQLVAGWLLPAMLPDSYATVFQESFMLYVESVPLIFDGRAGVVTVDVNVMLYGYGLPIAFGLIMSTPLSGSQRARQLLIAVAACLAVQTFGACADALQQAAYGQGPELRATLPQSAWFMNAIAAAYQLGYLVFPAIMPIVIWFGLNRAFIEQLIGRPLPR